MLYNVISNGEDVSYIPTPMGYALLAVLFIALLAAALFFAAKKSPAKASPRLSTKQLAFCAISITLGTVLSNVKLFSFPFGGSVTLLSMLFICLPGYWFGLGTGLTTGVAYGILQLIIKPEIVHPAQFPVDYILAFGALGLSGLFYSKKNALLKGYAAAVVGRWIFASLSGWIFWGQYAWEGWHPGLYSFTYNGIYIFAEAAVTMIILAVPYVKNAFERVRRLALE